MLRYIDEYPERLHHPKEDQYLFARLAKRSADARNLVDDLKGEHVEGARLIRELERAFLFFEEQWPAGGREFLAAVDDYAEFQWAHMRKEEQQLLPLAERHLRPEDWEAINNAFTANTDPLEDLKERDFDKLLSRIANLAPAPVGLGDPWKKARARP
jgi:hemerythrin-like domain-containing protein